MLACYYSDVASITDHAFFPQRTFRLQINLPLQQKMVLRVSPRQTLHDVLLEICQEKSLDVTQHTLRNPRDRERTLDLSHALADEQTNELTLMSSSNSK